jgi:hypothetical protein
LCTCIPLQHLLRGGLLLVFSSHDILNTRDDALSAPPSGRIVLRISDGIEWRSEQQELFLWLFQQAGSRGGPGLHGPPARRRGSILRGLGEPSAPQQEEATQGPPTAGDGGGGEAEEATQQPPLPPPPPLPPDAAAAAVATTATAAAAAAAAAAPAAAAPNGGEAAAEAGLAWGGRYRG